MTTLFVAILAGCALAALCGLWWLVRNWPFLSFWLV